MNSTTPKSVDRETNTSEPRQRGWGDWSRIGLSGTVFVAGAWLLVTQSLPYAVATWNPELALWLNPRHPAPLLARATQLRDTLIRSTTAKDTGSVVDVTAPLGAADADSSATAGTETQNPSDKRSARPDTQHDAVRAEIRKLAHRVLAVEPLSARAHRLLGEFSQDRATARRHMQAAVARSRRESIAVLWLLNDRFVAQDYAEAVTLADILLRTRPALDDYAIGYIARIAETPTGEKLLVAKLARAPPWRSRVLRRLAQFTSLPTTPLNIMRSLKETGAPVLAEDQTDYLQHLISEGAIELAYTAWLQLLPKDEFAKTGFLNNSGFESRPRPIAFDWRIDPARNAIAGFAPKPGVPDERAFHIVFRNGRITFPSLKQTLVLGAGAYQLDWMSLGRVRGKRGLKWRVICQSGATVAESEPLLGRLWIWTRFSMRLVVPDDAKCRSQTLELIHDARSESERFLDGEIWLDDLSLIRAAD